MKNLGKIIGLSVVMFFAFAKAGTAQNSANSLLNEVTKKVQGYDNIAIEFKYSLDNSETNTHSESRGDVMMSGEKYRLNILGITQLYDGKKLYMISTEDEEINISTPDEDDEDAITPSSMMTFYKDGYASKMDKTENVRGRKIQYVKLTPIDSRSENKEVMLGIDAQTNHIYNLVQTQKNGTKITITVTSFKPDQNLSPSTFVFDKSKYSDFYINKLD